MNQVTLDFDKKNLKTQKKYESCTWVLFLNFDCIKVVMILSAVNSMNNFIILQYYLLHATINSRQWGRWEDFVRLWIRQHCGNGVYSVDLCTMLLNQKYRNTFLLAKRTAVHWLMNLKCRKKTAAVSEKVVQYERNQWHWVNSWLNRTEWNAMANWTPKSLTCHSIFRPL